VFISVNLHEHQPIKFHIIHDKDKILCQDSKIDFLICHDRKKQYRSPPFIRLLPLMANLAIGGSSLLDQRVDHWWE
jgi:hypothetical protein